MIYPCPKPPKGRNKPEVVRRVNRSDAKQIEIRRSRPSWEERREEVGSRSGFRCDHCGRPAPLHNETLEAEEGAMPQIIWAGQAAHRKARKMGGGFRNDSIENLMWLCWSCHRLQTAGKLVIE